ncbi:NAD(P)-binding protein [Leucogyrophana mollusca]|uniref:NAD(P)-binding protein n=1 Tax=Leucogyrophana mollusca TaxID=85980 RepID=A0ACB8BN77_9AGAM|nr:NAD(P)-binding protein [Leucogyrophana mollusca]
MIALWLPPILKTFLFLVVLYTATLSSKLFRKKWNPRGLHVYITGGSQGLGLALAILVAKKGAHVSIVARTQSKLEKALIELEAARQTPGQIFRAYPFALDNAESSAAALKAASEGHGGQVPDAVFACAGGSKPMFFLDMEERDLTQGMDNGYWVQAWTAFAAAKQMVRQGKKGKIVLVSSTLGLMSFVGYSSYSPAKHALRGLAEALHSELMLYGIDTHIFFPPTMYTPGFNEENRTKPAVTRMIESTDKGLTPEQAASALLTGVENGETQIVGDLITNLFRASTRGAAPRNNVVVDIIYDAIALIGVPIWRSSVDKHVLAHRQEHQEYLQKRSFF